MPIDIPGAEALVAGAVRAKRYDYYAMQVLRHVVLRGREFDPTENEHEFTDWRAPEKVLSSFLSEEANLTKRTFAVRSASGASV